MPALRLPAALVVVAVVALVAGCGRDELRGEPDVPDGYALYRGEGVVFAHPEGFEAETETNANGVREVMLRDPAAGAAGPYIHLTIAPERGADIEPLARSVRVAAESIFKGEVGDEREVDVEGAVAARRVDIRQPSREGPVFERRSLMVLGPDERFYVLSAAVPEDDADAVDGDAVIGSFRLGGAA